MNIEDYKNGYGYLCTIYDSIQNNLNQSNGKKVIIDAVNLNECIETIEILFPGQSYEIDICCSIPIYRH